MSANASSAETMISPPPTPNSPPSNPAARPMAAASRNETWDDAVSSPELLIAADDTARRVPARS
jgi:hypothetical protein